MNMPRPADSYNFPVYPYTPEWDQLSNKEKDEAFQVPICVLKKMSTQAIIQAILENVYSLSKVFSQGAFDRFFPNNTAYLELLTRTDAGAALLERLDLGVSASTKYLIDMLISQVYFLSQLDVQQKRKLVEICLEENYDIEFTYEISCFLIGRTMYAAGYAPFVEAVNNVEDWKNYLDGYDPEGYSVTYTSSRFNDFKELIMQFGRNYLNGK